MNTRRVTFLAGVGCALLVLALIGLTFLFQSYVVGAGASVLATAIMLLELFVAFLQAFVFTLLTSVFIGLMRAEH